jgi:hypothetical protein
MDKFKKLFLENLQNEDLIRKIIQKVDDDYECDSIFFLELLKEFKGDKNTLTKLIEISSDDDIEKYSIIFQADEEIFNLYKKIKNVDDVESEISFPNPEDVIDRQMEILNYISEIKEDLEKEFGKDLRLYMMANYLVRSIEEKIDICNSLEFDDDNNITINNNIINQSINPKSKLCRKSFCEIETCECFDKYKNVCDVCNLHVNKKPIRIPVELGGWKGTFCSKECLLSKPLSKIIMAKIKILENYGF